MDNLEFFNDCKDVFEVKKLFRKLVLKNHPDQGGCEATMKRLNLEYQKVLKSLDGTKTEDRTYNYKEAEENELMKVINDLQQFRGLEIDLIGYWIWVSGDTKPIKEELKKMGLKWHSKRSVWYYKPLEWKSKKKYSSKADLSELAAKYGSSRFDTADKVYYPVAA